MRGGNIRRKREKQATNDKKRETDENLGEETFLLLLLGIDFWLCAFLMCSNILLMQRLGVIDIFMI